MSVSSPVQILSDSLAHAKYNIFPKAPYDGIVVEAMYSTTYQPPGTGGQALYMVYCVALSEGSSYAVYFNGKYAYFIKRASESFYKDLCDRRLFLTRKKGYEHAEDQA